jgi:hypothetical protein
LEDQSGEAGKLACDGIIPDLALGPKHTEHDNTDLVGKKNMEVPISIGMDIDRISGTANGLTTSSARILFLKAWSMIRAPTIAVTA